MGCILINKILRRGVGNISKASVMLFLFFFFIIVLLCYYFGILVMLTFLAIILFIGIFFLVLFHNMKYFDQQEENKGEVSFSRTLMDMGYTMTIFILIEFLFIFVALYKDAIDRKDYNILTTNTGYEVVIETYSDYYITKKAFIENENLYIVMDSQNVRNTKDCELNKTHFLSVYFK